VFTTNRFCAAPVTVAREHLAQPDGIRALVVNTGNANAGTGEQGMQDARATCAALAGLLGCKPSQILPFSTGVIMEPLPVAKIAAGLPRAVADAVENNWFDAAHAIMTTDIVAKAVSRQIQIDGKTVTVTGMSKGSGMIHPNMATMLGYIATDAAVAQPLLQQIVSEAANRSFNCITVDGDTSTNDALMLIATGKSGAVVNEANRAALQTVVTEVATVLAQAIVRDGEGATKFITIRVEGGKDEASARRSATPSRIPPWSRPRSSLPTPIWGASSPPSATRAWAISMSIRCRYIWTTCWSRRTAGAPRATARKTVSA